MHRGYTKRWRRRWEKGYHKDRLLWVLMDYFIDHANYKDGEVFLKTCGVVPIKRGQHIFGTLTLAELMGVDRQRIRTKLQILKNIQFLTIKSTNKYSIATVINYDTYQPVEDQINQQTTQSLTSNKPATNQQLTTHKKDKKENKDKNIKYTYPDWLNMDLWSDFKKMRTRIKKPITTNSTITRLLNTLKKLMDKGHDQDEIIQTAIDCCWQSFYAPKNQNKLSPEEQSAKEFLSPEEFEEWKRRRVVNG